jgi:protein O-GlcNAc transferase
MGVVLRQQGQYAEAMSCFQKAIGIEPCSAEAHNNRGNLFQDRGNMEAAAESYRKALAIRPNFVQALNNLGMAYQGMGQSGKAVACFQKAKKIQPDGALAHRHLVHQLQKDCAWENLEACATQLDKLTQLSLDTGNCPAEDPFLNLTRHADPAYNFAVARARSADICRRTAGLQPGFSFGDRHCSSKPITIGYLSNNFHDHPMAHLLLGLFRLHDRNQFNINCYSCGKEDDSYYRRRILRDCDRFVDLRDLNHLEAAGAIYHDRVDILVDLMGHTRGSRMEICALRPAPIQVRYLGLAGTTGADFFDYLLTDKIVTPEAYAPHYTENFAYLPHCYQINDYKQTYRDDISGADEPKLPTDPFIFCSFSQDYKIEPVMFGCWMQILRRVPDSILWLMVRHKTAVENLRIEAQKRGINPDRLVFVGKRSKSDHLNRLRRADLALDTRIVNGAATTSDALWAGVPVITLEGTHFASRMSASILTAVGLPELIAHSIEEYEAIAVQTALDRDRLAGLRQKLANNRLTEPLFDTPRLARNLEQAYCRMWQIFQAGSKPCQFEVMESHSACKPIRTKSGK